MEEPIAEWQKQESLKRLAEMKADPLSALSEEEFLKALDEKK